MSQSHGYIQPVLLVLPELTVKADVPVDAHGLVITWQCVSARSEIPSGSTAMDNQSVLYTGPKFVTVLVADLHMSW